MPWKTISAAAIGAAFILTALIAYGAFRWRRASNTLLERLEAARRPVSPASRAGGTPDGLPDPVRRYLRAALAEGQPAVASVVIEHAGDFNVSETGETWRPFTSTQRVVTARPGFVWDGRIGMAPGLSILVHDAYVAGEGILSVSLLGLLGLADMRGTPEMARSEMMRFLAEAVWYPTALLPSENLRWEAAGASAARATLTDGGVEATLLFRFGGTGLVESVRSEARGRTVAGKVIPTPWEGRWSDYEERGGMLIPMKGEVAWLLPDGPKVYWRGRITGIEYEFAR